MEQVGVFPFGQPILRVIQKDRTPKRVFVLGVYASAVHARWIGENGQQKIGAVGVASEPEIFWQGNSDIAKKIIESIHLPKGAGRLIPAPAQLNGPSGKALDNLFLEPLGFSRVDAWLCDLIPYSCMNEQQEIALNREYDPLRDSLGLPSYEWPLRHDNWPNSVRRSEIECEIVKSGAEVLITLGDEPLKWFTQYYGSAKSLSEYEQTSAEYGRLHPFTVAGQNLSLLPLVHPRQAARLGSHSTKWANLHAAWKENKPIKLFKK